jgi:EAL domain-containing protein (putative c-di-GMP-specific phosphodiesterase class I)
MPLSDFIRTLNSVPGHTPGFLERAGLDHPFVAADGRIFIHYANIRLESQFLPVVETGTGKLFGHAAAIEAHGLSNNIPMSPDAIFVLPSDDEEFVYLDRLVRTLHALNYLTRPTRGNLMLRVHARHVLSVPANHGLAFEEILRPCGLFPEQITLEIDTDAVEDKAHFIRAIGNYRSRGYSIAIGQFGRSHLDFDFLKVLQPDIVKLSPALISHSNSLDRIIEAIHRQGAKVMIDGIDTASLRRAASAENIDLLQAYAPLLGTRQADERWLYKNAA